MATMQARQQFATNLRQQRIRRGLSQEELGYAAGLHRTEISLLERAGRDPRLSTLTRLAQALKIPAATLLRDIE